MKIRLDFVTNSSSSSFILGEPNGNTVTTDDVIKKICEAAKQVVDDANKLRDILRSDKETRSLLDQINECKYVDAFQYCKQLRQKLDNIKDTIVEVFGANSEYLKGIDCDLLRDGIIDSIKSYASFEFVKKHYSENIFDIRKDNCLDKWDLSEIFDWYSDEVDDDSEDTEYYDYEEMEAQDYRKLIYSKLGEVFFYGECGDLPYLIVNKLFNMNDIRYKCNHMG